MSDLARSTGREYLEDQAKELERMLQTLTPVLVRFHAESSLPDTKVVDFKTPKEFKDAMCLDLKDDAQTEQEIVEDIKDIMKLSVRTSHPLFLDKLFAGPDAIGQVAELLTASLNTNVHTYAVSQAMVMTELQVLKLVAQKIGFNPETSEGVLVPGGSYANMLGMITARHKHFPHVRMDGWKPEDKPVVFASAQAHYSVRRATMMLGFGMNGTVAVEADINGAMIPSELEAAVIKAKEEGKSPFMVSCTAGTTVMGGFDHFEQISEICKRHGLWMHVDAAWGGPCIMSENQRHLIQGVELADSFTWDGHKGYGMPIFAAACIVNNHPGLLHESNNSSANYLFHKHDYADYDLGDMTLQCGRRADSLKIWLSFRRHGLRHYADRIDHAVNLTKSLADKVEQDDRFVLVTSPQYTNCCFWYIPPCIRDRVQNKTREGCKEIYSILDKITPLIYSRMQKAGNMLINFNPLADHGLPRFFRCVFNQPQVSFKHIDKILMEIDNLGSTITLEDLSCQEP